MAYTSKQICSIPFYDYVNLMVIELNENGFRVMGREETDNYKFPTNPDNFVLSIKDDKAISFLVNNGLLNNGRCPISGLSTCNDSCRIAGVEIQISSAMAEYKLLGMYKIYGFFRYVLLLLIIIGLFVKVPWYYIVCTILGYFYVLCKYIRCKDKATLLCTNICGEDADLYGITYLAATATVWYYNYLKSFNPSIGRYLMKKCPFKACTGDENVYLRKIEYVPHTKEEIISMMEKTTE